MRAFIFTILLSLAVAGTASADKHSGFDFKSVKQTCKGNHGSEACQKKLSEAREYCDSRKDDKHCEKFHKKMHMRSMMHKCKDNPDSQQCKKFKEKMEKRCAEKPESKPCKKYQAALICKDRPDSEECKAAKKQVKEMSCDDHKDHKDHKDHEDH